MSEAVFTEPQWRAIAEIERRSEQSYYYCTATHEKRLSGPSFRAGEFFLGISIPWAHEKFVGPVSPTYFVFEKRSALRITWNTESKHDAISSARDRLAAAPHDYLVRMIAAARAETEKEVAETEAREAIQSAARQAKKDRAANKKVGRRRTAIFEESGGRCHYCGTGIELRGNWHVEHKMPKALGGSNERVNLVAACAPCNQAKKDKTDVEFFALLHAQSQSAIPE